MTLFIAFVAFASPARAESTRLGNGKLVSFYTEDPQTKQRTNTYGEHPTGAIGFTPAGRFFAFERPTAASRRRRSRTRPPPSRP